MRYNFKLLKEAKENRWVRQKGRVDKNNTEHDVYTYKTKNTKQGTLRTPPKNSVFKTFVLPNKKL